MKLTYETGTATLIQLVVLSFFNIINGLNSVVTTCHREGRDCVSNLLVSIIFYILIVTWFGFVWMIGYMAQQRRSKRLAQLLICAEGMIALVALFNLRHHADVMSFTTSLVDLLLAIWIVSLAFRLMKSNGKRITGRHRRRSPLKS